MPTMHENTDSEKHKIIDRLLKDRFVLVHISPTVEGIALPQNLMQNPTVTLKLSRYFRGDLKMQRKEIVVELLFGSDYFSCQIPYASIWAVTSEDGSNTVWPEAAPNSVLKNFLQSAIGSTEPKADQSTPKKNFKRKTTHLRRVK